MADGGPAAAAIDAGPSGDGAAGGSPAAAAESAGGASTPPATVRWAGRLALDVRRDLLGGLPRSVLHDRHDGPLRVLRPLYPEGPAVCHAVLVHPPGGLVGGDRLEIDCRLREGAHLLATTPGATRFYRTTGAPAAQHVEATLDDGARLEWLPLETLAYDACRAENTLRLRLAPGAEAIGWDVLALGLPAAGRPFTRGSVLQSIEVPGRWLERGRIDAADTRLLDSPLGWAGMSVLGTLWFAAGGPLGAARRDAVLDAARAACDAVSVPDQPSGVTSPEPGLVVLRVLATRVEPAMAAMVAVWSAWRQCAWQLPATVPRVWRT